MHCANGINQTYLKYKRISNWCDIPMQAGGLMNSNQRMGTSAEGQCDQILIRVNEPLRLRLCFRTIDFMRWVVEYDVI